MDDQLKNAYSRAAGQIEEMVQRLNVSAVFGEPVREGDVTLIPTGSVVYGFGSGQGWGREAKEPGTGEVSDETSPKKNGEGGGAGGGGGGAARPLGYIRVDREGVRWEPIVDAQRMGLSGMFLAGWIAFCVAIVIRSFAKKG